MKKIITAVMAFSLLFVLVGCSSNVEEPIEKTSFYEMLKDTSFVYDGEQGSFEVVVKQGAVLILEYVDGNLHLPYGDIVLVGDATNAKNVESMPIDAVPMIISTEVISINPNAKMFDRDGNLLIETKTKLPAVNFIRMQEIDGVEHFEMVVGGRAVYINVDEATIVE